jgi:hypothetical protein
MKNLPPMLREPSQTKHKKLYDTVNDLIDYLEEHYEPENEFVGTINSVSKVFTPAGGASPSNKATKCCDGECHHDDCCGKIPENCNHKPHWESDYAAIWERWYENGEEKYPEKVRQDILELIRGLQ